MSDTPEYLSLGLDGGRIRPPFQLERVIGATAKTFAANLLPFLFITTVIDAPAIVLNLMALRDMRPGMMPNWPLFGVAFLTAMIGRFLIQGTLTFGVFQHLRGKPVKLGECFVWGVRKAWTAFLTSLLVALAVMAGFIACVIPGLYIFVIFSVSVPVAVVEGNGALAALTRSRQLTTGHGWPVFGVFVLFYVVVGVPSAIINILLANNFLALAITSSVYQIFAVTIAAVLACVVYYQLRESEEDLDTTELAAVFD